MEREISILGSCVTRDPFNYCYNPPRINYIARQSIAALLNNQKNNIPIAHSLHIDSAATSFEKRNLAHDFKKDVFDSLPKDIPLILDLIDERHEIIEMEDGGMYVNSVIASQHSNLTVLAKRKIAPLEPERVSMMGRALPDLARELRKFKTLVVHLAYFDEDFTEFWINSQEFNLRLKTAHDYILRTVPGAIALEMPQYLCRAARGNPWGYAPMHYVVDYYLRFLYEFERKMNYGLLITPWPKIPAP